MKKLSSNRIVLSVYAAGSLLAACGAPQPIGLPTALPQAPAVGPGRAIVHHIGAAYYRVLYKFRSFGYDARGPLASLIDVKGTLYGTTVDGGAYTNGGTVFSIKPTGKHEQVLHSFGNGSDGISPAAGLLNVNGTLYGTTSFGGAYGTASGGGGTVFSIQPTGKQEQVLHSFGSGSDGALPFAGLLDVNGTLYGTTRDGGTYGYGTVFSISTTGTEHVLYSFAGEPDGALPDAGLIDVKGTLYGATANGGSSNCMGGCGTVFSISTTGTEHVLYRFLAGTDGWIPAVSLLDVKGTLYGTTQAGGGHNNPGTVFSVSRTGTEQVLYRFGVGSDGDRPLSSLINVHGTLYGTTVAGGAYGTATGTGGTVFSIRPSGKHEQVLHSFGTRSDGEGPEAALIDLNGTLYGTTCCGALGDGTVFALSP
jgi:uncharacterized repeat protein (TIGR03803 family)